MFMSFKKPSEFKRRVLLAISGMSPQIFTETLWALTQSSGNSFVPTEIRLLTTAGGARSAKRNLFDKSKFAQFCNEYGIDESIFSVENIVVITNDGQPMEDIRTPEENEAAADFITDVIRDYTQDDDTALHVSMAGGRKTMGYYAGYALSLFAREQDRLSHVLVSEEYEGLPDFYYPTKNSCLIDGRDKQVLDAKDAEVILAKIPFVRLRNEVPELLLSGKASFKETIQNAQRINEEVSLIVDTANAKITAGNVLIELSPILTAFYAWMIYRSVSALPDVSVRELLGGDTELAQQFLQIYEQLYVDKDTERTRSGLSQGMDKDWFDEKRSRVHKALRDKLGKTLAEKYYIISSGPRGGTRYHVKVESDYIFCVKDNH